MMIILIFILPILVAIIAVAIVLPIVLTSRDEKEIKEEINKKEKE